MIITEWHGHENMVGGVFLQIKKQLDFKKKLFNVSDEGDIVAISS